MVPRALAERLELVARRSQQALIAGGRRAVWPVAEVSLVLLGQDVTTPCLIAPDGSALLGAVALGMGYLVALTGPRLAAIYPAAGMVVVLGFLFLGSVLWRHTAEA